MTKKPKTDGKEPSLIAKAIRRGEKLERTLTKLMRFNDPHSHAETFLKAVQKGLEHIRKEPVAPESEAKTPKKKAKAAEQGTPKKVATASVPAKRIRKPKKPDIVALTEAKSD